LVLDSSWQPQSAALAPGAAVPPGFVVIHFWATWNGHDRTADSLIQTIRPHFGERVQFLSFDTGPKEGWEFCRVCKILNLPALAAFSDGRHIGTMVGFGGVDSIKTKIEEWLAS